MRFWSAPANVVRVLRSLSYISEEGDRTFEQADLFSHANDGVEAYFLIIVGISSETRGISKERRERRYFSTE